MFRRIVPYLIALTVLGFSCAVYHTTFVAWVEPAPLPELTMASSPVLRKDDVLSALFPPGSWQRGDCKRLQTRDGVLLFENWQQMSDDQWKLWPVAVVMGSNSRSPLILEAAEGAEIKFTESLDVMSGGAPPIELGRMIGAVRIRNAITETKSPDGDDDNRNRRIEIEASEVGIDHRKVWTTRPIRVQLGDAQLLGRDLTLHLSMVGAMVAPGENALSILDRLELIYLDELTMPIPSGGLWGETTVPDARPGLAMVRCAGRVVFQFTTGELTLQDRVELHHQATLSAPVNDTFTCDQLRLRFTDLLSKRQRGDAIENYLLSLVAVGRPAKASLPSVDAQLAAGRIEFDTRQHAIRMSGPAGVLVSYAGNRWQFGQVTYLIHPTDPKSLGTFDSAGPGSMAVAENPEVPVKNLQWSGGIKLERMDGDNLFALQVDGDVLASMTDGGSFQCNSAQLIVQQAPPAQASAAQASPGSDDKLKLIPKRFQANGKVLLETPVIAVATRLLQLYFEMAPDSEKGAAIAPNATASSESPLRRWVRQPGEELANAVLASNATPVVKARPSVHGDTIVAKLRLSAGDVLARDLTIGGNVALRHEIQTKGGPLPATFTGDRLVLSDGGGNDILQIGSGADRPAMFKLGDGYFIGPQIQVRMADNVVWIKDAGEFQMPSQVLPRIGALASRNVMSPIDESLESVSAVSRESSSKVEFLSAPRCRWKGQMVFDGRTVTLTEGVDIHTKIVSGPDRELWDIQLVGDQLQLVLDQSVRLREVETVKAATVDHVSITGSANHPLLVTANQLTSTGIRKGRHVLAAPQLTMHPESGMLNGPGPGWYRAWLDNDPTPQFSMVNQDTSSSPPSMLGLHLIYDQSLDVDLKAKSLDFIRGVRIGTKNVSTWDDLIDVTKMQGLRLGESTLACDRLRMAVDNTKQWAPQSMAWEVETIGNVNFQTRIDKGLFSGTADHASYTAAKDVFLIEGSPGRSSVISQTLPTGQPGMSLRSKRMTINPKTMEIQNMDFDGFQLGTLPTAPKL
jgi:hypothetical protein